MTPHQLTGLTSREDRGNRSGHVVSGSVLNPAHHEGRDYRGRDAIRRWKLAADERCWYTMQPLSAQIGVDEVTVRAPLTGNFPGTALELSHFLKLSKDKIASLEVR